MLLLSIGLEPKLIFLLFRSEVTADVAGPFTHWQLITFLLAEFFKKSGAAFCNRDRNDGEKSSQFLAILASSVAHYLILRNVFSTSVIDEQYKSLIKILLLFACL